MREQIQVEVSDRYSATGTPYPNRWTVCKGHCEGMGFYPENDQSEWPTGTRPYDPTDPEDDGWRFIKCPTCKGTGRRVNGLFGRALDFLHTWVYPFTFALWTVRHRFEDQTMWDAVREVPRMFRSSWRQQRVQRVLLRRKWKREAARGAGA